MKKLILLLILIFSLPVAAQNFTIGKSTFLLNGKPFTVKAAELHYTRIPAPYWEHRIEMCKALGMNTICLYVFWNIHEQTEGQFDFTGQNDIAAFCRLAQKHGMYVIVRPGPYVCAEWEMGGLPWWLLKKKDIVLRTLDPYFMERTAIFMKEVGKQLAPLQITRGGNIIMVQVENEYGAYAVDKPYVSAIRDIVKSAGFTEVPLFQCDWSSTFDRNGLDDLLWTINFGTGANIEQQFKRLREARPETPLMCSEFWSGWFDHWGRKHETRPAKSMVQGIKDMLDRNISFSLYMAHGGTTFGHWGGANNPSYSAMCSSYDYDAPISEPGWTTDKYFQLRDLLKNYLPAGEQLPEIPEAFPVIEIPEVEFTQIAPLFSNLPEAKESMDIQPMEAFDQGWGTILYRTTLQEPVENGTTMKITEVHDWAQVFADGKLLARLDRRRGEFALQLPALKKGTRIDILVEAMGRVNFDESIHDRKGITEKVELVRGKQSAELKNWTVYSFPVDYSFVQDKRYKNGTAQTMPAYYRTTFRLDKVGDTFLDMSTWGKGMVWGNGLAIGRFWEIGPQQTLFMPGCWLKEGENEIVVFEMEDTGKRVLQGLNQPILDSLGIDKNYQKGQRRAVVGTPILEDGDLALKTTLQETNEWQSFDLPVATTLRHFCIETLSSYTEDNQACISEVELIDDKGQPIDKTKWEVVYVSSEQADKNLGIAENLFDGDISSFWHTNAAVESNHPHRVIIDLKEIYKVSAFRVKVRKGSFLSGKVKDINIYGRPQFFLFH